VTDLEDFLTRIIQPLAHILST